MPKNRKLARQRPRKEKTGAQTAAERQRGLSRLMGLLTALVLLLVIVVMVLSQLFDTPILKAPRELVARVVTPIQRTFATGTDFMVDYLRTLKLRSNFEYEYRLLQEKVDELTDKAMLAESLQQQVLAYADLDDEVRRNPGLNGIKADIIGRDTSNYSFVLTLNVGANNGVTDNMAVVVPGALVGITFDTLDATTKVRGIIDTNVAVAAVIQSNRDPGTVSGTLAIDGTQNCRMYYLSYTTLPRPGDMVVTSGMNTGLPKGIPIGRVRESTRGMEDSKQFIVLEPIANFDHMEYVIVYRYQQTVSQVERHVPPEPTFVPLPSIRPVPTFIGQEEPVTDPDATPGPDESPEAADSPSPTPTETLTPPPEVESETAQDEGISYNAPVIVDTTPTPEPSPEPIPPSPSPTFSPEDMTVEEDP
ncbi:MAG: rod shape-determining protein MreC [Clostridiales bacterium]|mgnify:CR=1 FL=1|nr:rod shape-determining protein MreC [Clostridiales bacterium]